MLNLPEDDITDIVFLQKSQGFSYVAGFVEDSNLLDTVSEEIRRITGALLALMPAR